jgi:hypothetical protein
MLLIARRTALAAALLLLCLLRSGCLAGCGSQDCRLHG